MINFFRKIRKQLADANKPMQYLRYALGEILLVVIGILIALSINNWNDERKLRQKERKYLLDLKTETTSNVNILKSVIGNNRENFESAKEIAYIIASKNQIIEESKFSLMNQIAFMQGVQYNPKDAIINEIISTGSLKDIHNDKIKEFVSSWYSNMSTVVNQEIEISKYRQKCTDLLVENGNLKRMFDDTDLSTYLDLKEGYHDKGNLSLLSSTIYENNLLLFIATSTLLNNIHYESMLKELDNVLELIDIEIEN